MEQSDAPGEQQSNTTQSEQPDAPEKKQSKPTDYADDVLVLVKRLKRCRDNLDKAAELAMKFVKEHTEQEGQSGKSPLYSKHWQFQLDTHDTVSPLVSMFWVQRKIAEALADACEHVARLAKQPNHGYLDQALEDGTTFLRLCGIKPPTLGNEGELIVTRRELFRLTGGLVEQGTIENHMHKSATAPTPCVKGKGQANRYCYSEMLEWWPTQNFVTGLPTSEEEAREILSREK